MKTILIALLAALFALEAPPAHAERADDAGFLPPPEEAAAGLAAAVGVSAMGGAIAGAINAAQSMLPYQPSASAEIQDSARENAAVPTKEEAGRVQNPNVRRGSEVSAQEVAAIERMLSTPVDKTAPTVMLKQLGDGSGTAAPRKGLAQAQRVVAAANGGSLEKDAAEQSKPWENDRRIKKSAPTVPADPQVFP